MDKPIWLDDAVRMRLDGKMAYSEIVQNLREFFPTDMHESLINKILRDAVRRSDRGKAERRGKTAAQSEPENPKKQEPVIENLTPSVVTVNWDGTRTIRFGLMGDTQINSKYTQLTHLHDFYDLCAHEGLADVYHTGDIDEGEQMRQGHQYECYNQGADDHADEIIKVYPKRNGITTHFITGNHDASMIKHCGHDIGRTIAEKRIDMNYLGRDCSVIQLTPNCSLELRHPWDGTCFDDKTEIFTRRGWIPFPDLSTDDYVATMTKQDHSFQWQQPEFVTVQQYSGQMYHIKARTVDMVVTPKHGLWTRRSSAGLGRRKVLFMPQKAHAKHDDGWHRETAQDVCNYKFMRQRWQMTNACDGWHGVPHAQTVEIPRVESKNTGCNKAMQHIGAVSIIDYCQLVAWYVTEGYSDKKRVSICQSNRVNPDCHSNITDLLDRIGVRYCVSGKDEKDIAIGSVELSEHLRTACGTGSRNKYIPSWMLDLPSEYLRVIFDTMILGDGWYRGSSFGYKSVSPRLRDGITEIAVKLGYAVCESNDTVLITAVQKWPTINKKPSVVEYNGMVYCCKVPNELIFVRRNGKATWSHNSYAISYKIQKMIEAMSGGEKPSILAIGHYHKAEYIMYRNVHSFQTGTFQAQTPWMRGKGIAAMMGGWIVEIEVDSDGSILRIRQEFIPYYKAIKDDYKNFSHMR